MISFHKIVLLRLSLNVRNMCLKYAEKLFSLVRPKMAAVNGLSTPQNVSCLDWVFVYPYNLLNQTINVVRLKEE